MEIKEAVAALGALAQETRLAVFRLMIEAGPSGIAAGQIGEALDVPPATLSFHLKELAQSGLIIARQQGRFIWYRPDFVAMNALVGYLSANCCEASAAFGAGCVPAVTVAIPNPKKRRTA